MFKLNCPIDFEHGWDDDTVDQFFSDYLQEDLSTSERVSFIKEILRLPKVLVVVQLYEYSME